MWRMPRSSGMLGKVKNCAVVVKAWAVEMSERASAGASIRKLL